MNLAEGHVWTFRQATPEDARVIIQKIEPWPAGGEAVHVSVYGLRKVQGRFDGVITHMPFSRAAVEASLDQLVSDAPPAGIEILDGYNTWLEDKGGIFSLTVADAAKHVLDVALGGHAGE